jgi:hypothetical protein
MALQSASLGKVMSVHLVGMAAVAKSIIPEIADQIGSLCVHTNDGRALTLVQGTHAAERSKLITIPVRRSGKAFDVGHQRVLVLSQ